MAQGSLLLQLPRELRDQILFYVFFDATSRRAVEAVAVNGRSRQVVATYPKEHGHESLPQHLRSGHAPAQGFDVSVLRTCRQLRHEGEEMLYSNIKFDLWAYRLDYDSRRTLLEQLGPANRARLAHLRISGLNLCDVLDAQMPLCEWKYLTTYIAANCTSLQTLELRVTETIDFDAEHPWKTIAKNGPWLQALLQIKGLQDLSFSLEADALSDDDSFSALAVGLAPELICAQHKELGSWLKQKMTEQGQRDQCADTFSLQAPFDFLKLPENVQKVIIRHTVLPPDGVIHPSLPAHINENAANILPMLLSCHAISGLTEEVIYEESLFSCCNSRSKQSFKEFLRLRSPRQQQLMRQFYCAELDQWTDRTFITFRRTKFPNLVDWNEKGGFRWWIAHHPCFSV